MTGLEEIEQFMAAGTRPPMMDLFDIDLLEAACCGVALCAKPILREHADVVVDVPSFTPLRWLLGL